MTLNLQQFITRRLRNKNCGEYFSGKFVTCLGQVPFLMVDADSKVVTSKPVTLYHFHPSWSIRTAQYDFVVARLHSHPMSHCQQEECNF